MLYKLPPNLLPNGRGWKSSKIVFISTGWDIPAELLQVLSCIFLTDFSARLSFPCLIRLADSWKSSDSRTRISKLKISGYLAFFWIRISGSANLSA